MTLSLSAVFVHFIISSNTFDFPYLFKYAFSMTLLAMGAMVIAFVTGAYAILAPSLGLELLPLGASNLCHDRIGGLKCFCPCMVQTKVTMPKLKYSEVDYLCR